MDCSKHVWLKSFKWVSNKRGHNVWLKLSAVPQEASGTAPQSRECAWNTNRGFTIDQWVSAGRGTGAACSHGIWRHSYSSFFNLLDMTLLPPFLPCPPLEGTNGTRQHFQHTATVAFSVCLRGRWVGGGGGGGGGGCCRVPDGLMGSLASGLQNNSVALDWVAIAPSYTGYI